MSDAASPRISHAAGPIARSALDGADAVAVLVTVQDEGIAVPSGLDGVLGVDLAGFAAQQHATGGAGEVSTLLLPPLLDGDSPWEGLPTRVLLAGAGDGGPTAMRRAGAALARAANGPLLVIDLGDHADGAGPLVEGLLLASYRQPYQGIGDGPSKPVAEVVLVGEPSSEALRVAEVAARATCRARLLAATPSNIKNPQWLAEQTVALAKESGGARAGLKVTVHDEQWIERTGLGGLAAVGQGSPTPPRLVVVEYTPAGRAAGAPVLLVGKGITYDTGGISIKPREAMVPMKTDMSGAAVVLATILAAAELALPQRVVAVLPLAENAFSGSAYRPGDVVRMYDGSTVEIGNTDAEGRMVLADAMAWGRAQFAPSVLVDVATLTGAAALALGKGHAPLYATTAELSDALTAAGAAAGEPLWPMPLVPEYRAALTSSVADVSHISTDPHVGAGSITAALFLERFAGDIPWAHLDIAGTGRADADRHEITKGPTGFAARTLLIWLVAL